ncbi:unnamed protein product [Euphydryas editha]|uniref:Anoctamin n=1 Tax=Euphydryas editha TaxID=104508 RepID=A0AAU9UJT1_EUPED|nr:unnamed protein product [Euphydryas editha]
MDFIKCDRFKTFREELPSKKFQFLNENDSIHKMKVVDEDSSSQNKANDAGCKILKEEFEKQEDELTTVRQLVASTGMFRDNLRRIDMVLVVEDNPSSNMDNLKITFFTNILKTGLEIELESGLMPAHKELSFIKIHAPKKVLTEYGEIFGVKRYFIDNRLDTISPKLRKFAKFNFFNNENEREWIKIVRKNYTTPNGYSHFERSLIVYKILLHLPFGDHANHYGINRLLKRNIILDAYALHDGPYFLIPKQKARELNARQILYYTWTGVQNIFKSQPLHLIHEYFGPTVTFYFAFYGYLNKALAVASIGGIITFVLPFIDKSEDILRPEFKIKYTSSRRSYKTGLKYNESEYYTFLRYLISKGIIVMYILAIFPIMSITIQIHNKFFDSFIMGQKKEKWWDYILLAMFQTVYTLLVSLLEKIYCYITHYAVNFENHRTHKTYEKSLIEKQFGFSMTLMYPFMGLRTDYSRGSKSNSAIPCWEREYALKNVDENFFTKNYLILAIQFSLITLFVVSFPLAPSVVLLINLWDLRHTASKLLLASKRPLHIRSPGIGAWNNMFSFTAYAAIITNAITLVFSTRLILRYYFASRNKPLNTTLDFVLVHLRTDENYYRKKECYSPEFLEPVGTTHKADTFHWRGLLDSMTRKSEYHMFSIYKVVFIFLFIHIMAFVGFLLKYFFPPIIREIKETKATERRIKTLYHHYKDAEESKEEIGSSIHKKV